MYSLEVQICSSSSGCGELAFCLVFAVCRLSSRDCASITAFHASYSVNSLNSVKGYLGDYYGGIKRETRILDPKT